MRLGTPNLQMTLRRFSALAPWKALALFTSPCVNKISWSNWSNHFSTTCGISSCFIFSTSQMSKSNKAKQKYLFVTREVQSQTLNKKSCCTKPSNVLDEAVKNGQIMLSKHYFSQMKNNFVRYHDGMIVAYSLLRSCCGCLVPTAAYQMRSMRLSKVVISCCQNH